MIGEPERREQHQPVLPEDIRHAPERGHRRLQSAGRAGVVGVSQVDQTAAPVHPPASVRGEHLSPNAGRRARHVLERQRVRRPDDLGREGTPPQRISPEPGATRMQLGGCRRRAGSPAARRWPAPRPRRVRAGSAGATRAGALRDRAGRTAGSGSSHEPGAEPGRSSSPQAHRSGRLALQHRHLRLAAGHLRRLHRPPAASRYSRGCPATSRSRTSHSCVASSRPAARAAPSGHHHHHLRRPAPGAHSRRSSAPAGGWAGTGAPALHQHAAQPVASSTQTSSPMNCMRLRWRPAAISRARSSSVRVSQRPRRAGAPPCGWSPGDSPQLPLPVPLSRWIHPSSVVVPAAGPRAAAGSGVRGTWNSGRRAACFISCPAVLQIHPALRASNCKGGVHVLLEALRSRLSRA